MKKNIFVLVSCVFTISSVSAGVPNDFDGDGTSDRTWVEIESDKSLTWTTELSSTRANSGLGSLGEAGDVVTMAQWLSGGTQIGVASLNTESEEIEWSIRDSQGVVRTKSFGKKGDLVVAGGDFDGNGLADAAVVRLEQGRARWEIRHDLFASDAPIERSVVFGQAGDRVFYARAEGTSSTDWVGVVRKGTRSRSVARMMDVTSGMVKQFARLPRFASEGSRPRPYPIRQASGPDLIGFSAASSGRTSVKVFSLQGAAVASAVFAGSGTSVVGEFLQGTGQEVLYESGEDAAIFNPAEIDITESVALGGIPVDEINVGTLGVVAATPTPSNGGGGGSGGSGGGGTISQCVSTQPWPGSHIYKTFGSHHFTDVRRNTIGVILKVGASGPFPSCVDAIDREGNVVAKLSLYARGAGWAARYYAGIGCGMRTPYNGTAVAARARANTGSSTIYMNFGGVCYGPIEATKCIGSTSC